MIYASGFSEPEGPLLLPEGSWLLTERGGDRGCVTHFSVERGIVQVARTGRPNGLGGKEKRYDLDHGKPHSVARAYEPRGQDGCHLAAGGR